MANEKVGVPSEAVIPRTTGATPADGHLTPTQVSTPDRPTRARGPVETKDNFREVVETIVFVVVLVLMLKSFTAEAFVIPTGSMAETLWGYQKVVHCPKCGLEFPVNCSNEVDPQPNTSRVAVKGCTCPNCRFHIDFTQENGRSSAWKEPGWNTGDRVVVAKFLYDTGLARPQRQEVVVFKYPEAPQRDHAPMNYIKRLIGLPGETIAIHYGNLYRFEGLTYDDEGVKPEDLWRVSHMHEDDSRALELFWDGKYSIVRKVPADLMALRRLVYDNDHQDRDLPQRWNGGAAWKAENPAEPKRFVVSGDDKTLAWLRYSHLLRDGAGRPELITDFMGYNSYEPRRMGQAQPAPNWVGDLMLDAEVTVEQPTGELVLELSEGPDRFQARWDLSSGVCTLYRVTGDKQEELGSKPTALKQKGTYRLRFANFDDRLTVWVDGALPFGDGVTYSSSSAYGPTRNDLQPASIGVRGGSLSVQKLKLWRDTYYTLDPGHADVMSSWDRDRLRFPPSARESSPRAVWFDDWSDPDKWEALRKLPAKTLYVQPGHYLCLGDNSPESSDGRTWGLVPERLLLGRALLIYYPLGRAGRIQ